MTSQDQNHKQPSGTPIDVLRENDRLRAEVAAIRSRWRSDVEDLRIEVDRQRANNASLLDLTADARSNSWRSTVDELRARLRLDDDETLEQEVTRLRGPQSGDDSSALRTVLRASLDAATRLAETDRPVEALEAVRLWLSVRELAARHGDLRES